MATRASRLVKQVRRQLELTQAQFGALLNVSEDVISRLERSISRPTKEFLTALDGVITRKIDSVKKTAKSLNKKTDKQNKLSEF